MSSCSLELSVEFLESSSEVSYIWKASLVNDVDKKVVELTVMRDNSYQINLKDEFLMRYNSLSFIAYIAVEHPRPKFNSKRSCFFNIDKKGLQKSSTHRKWNYIDLINSTTKVIRNFDKQCPHFRNFEKIFFIGDDKKLSRAVNHLIRNRKKGKKLSSDKINHSLLKCKNPKKIPYVQDFSFWMHKC